MPIISPVPLTTYHRGYFIRRVRSVPARSAPKTIAIRSLVPASIRNKEPMENSPRPMAVNIRALSNPRRDRLININSTPVVARMSSTYIRMLLGSFWSSNARYPDGTPGTSSNAATGTARNMLAMTRYCLVVRMRSHADAWINPCCPE